MCGTWIVFSSTERKNTLNRMQKRKPKTPIQQYCTMSTERAILLGMALMAQKSNTPISEVIAQYQQVGGDLHEKSAYRALNEDLRKFYQVKEENA